MLEAAADAIGDEPAVVHGEVRRTWREYEDRAARVASAYAAAGLEPGDRVGLLMYNGNEYLEAQFGAMKQRLVPINVNYRYGPEELVYLFDNSDSEAVFFDAAFAENVRAIRSRLPHVKLWASVGQRVEVARDPRRPGAIRCREDVGGGADAGEHYHSLESGLDGAGDVGVQTVADDERAMRTDPPGR